MAFKAKYDSIEKYLQSYGKYIVRQARRILQKRNSTGKLSKSLRYKLVKDQDGYDIKFLAAKYGDFIQKGVSGTQTKRSYIGIDGKRKQSPFSYKRGVGNAPNIGAIQSWIRLKNIRGRDNLGRFIKSKSLAYLFSKSIQRKGIKAASFYSQPLSWSYKKFKDDMLKNFKEDVLNNIKAFKK